MTEAERTVANWIAVSWWHESVASASWCFGSGYIEHVRQLNINAAISPRPQRVRGTNPRYAYTGFQCSIQSVQLRKHC